MQIVKYGKRKFCLLPLTTITANNIIILICNKVRDFSGVLNQKSLTVKPLHLFVIKDVTFRSIVLEQLTVKPLHFFINSVHIPRLCNAIDPTYGTLEGMSLVSL